MTAADDTARRREDRATRQAASAFLVALLAGLGMVVLYWRGGHTQLEGVLLFLALGGIGTGLGVWAKVLLREPEIVEDREPMRSAADDRAAFQQAFEESLPTAGLQRRRFLTRLLGGAALSLGLALLIPFRSLGPGPRGELFRTSWQRGVRLVTDAGRPLRPEDVVVDQVVTVFPAGLEEAERADAQALLIGLRPGRLDLPPDAPPTLDDLVVYSKICTHAGCPVGLFRAAAGELLCPCHQSTFDVYRGATPVSGPTARALPQLPLGVDDDGFLVALGDFPEPVGPSFWNMTDEPGTGS